MFADRSLIPDYHQRDWFDLTNHVFNSSLEDDILPRFSRKGWMGDEWRSLGSEQQHQVNWNGPNKFEVKLDVSHFTPEEIKVKVAGNSLLVEGKHSERQDKHGYVSRQFTRRYTLADDVDLERLSSSLDENGKTLAIHAPKKKFQLDGSGRVIPIIVRKKKQLEGARDMDMKG